MPEQRFESTAAAKSVVHLFRGAVCVRSWSKYQKTVKDWTLCGIDRQLACGPTRERAQCTEDPSRVSCRHCADLMSATAQPRAQAARIGEKGGGLMMANDPRSVPPVF